MLVPAMIQFIQFNHYATNCKKNRPINTGKEDTLHSVHLKSPAKLAKMESPLWMRQTLPVSLTTLDTPHLNGDFQSVDLVIGILSGRGEKYAARRTKARKSWKDVLAAQNTTEWPLRPLPLFFVGTGFCRIPEAARSQPFGCEPKLGWSLQSNETKLHLEREKLVTERLYQEAAIYGDMLLLNVQDFYHNSPVKVATYLAWVASSTSAKYVMKMDDDVFLDWRLLLERLTEKIADRDNRRLFWWGFLRKDVTTYRHDDRPHGIKPEDWLSRKWPPFMSGGGSILDVNAAHFIAKNYNELSHSIFGEDVALGVWLASTNVQYVQDSKTFPTVPDNRHCFRSYALLFMDTCKSEVEARQKKVSQFTSS